MLVVCELRYSQNFVTTFVTVKNCRLGSTANHIQYKYYGRYARDLTMGYARRPVAYSAARGIMLPEVMLLNLKYATTSKFETMILNHEAHHKIVNPYSL